MESYSTSYSSSKSSYISQNTKKPNESIKHEYPLQSNYSWLHSVRKSPTKTWKKNSPIAPMAPTQARVYKVDPINFRELVQSLTSAPEFMPPNLLQTNTEHTTTTPIVPNSLPNTNFSSRVDTEKVSTPLAPVSTGNNWYQYFQAELFGKSSEDEKEDEVITTPGLLEMNLFSPTSFGNWCFVPPIMSPTI